LTWLGNLLTLAMSEEFECGWFFVNDSSYYRDGRKRWGFQDGDLYQKLGRYEHILICRKTKKAKRFAPFFYLGRQRWWVSSEKMDYDALRCYDSEEFLFIRDDGCSHRYDEITKLYIHLPFKIAVFRISNWYYNQLLRRWRQNMKTVLAQIRAIPPHGVDYLAAQTHFESLQK
jgi:hypothetical protein